MSDNLRRQEKQNEMSERAEPVLETQEAREFYGKKVLRDFQRFVEKHGKEFDPDGTKEPVDLMWFFYEEFYRRNADNLRYKDSSETMQMIDDYNRGIATLVEEDKAEARKKFIPDEKWVYHNVNGGPDYEDESMRLGRFYLNLKPEEVVNFYKSSLKESMKRGLHVQMKIPMKGKLKSFNMRDKMVVYFDSEEEQQMLEMLQELYKNNKNAFESTGIPAFTSEVKDGEGNIMNGIGFGEEPSEEDETFGKIRAQILADIYMKIRQLKKKNPDADITSENYDELFGKYCKQQFYRVDPENPAFNLTRKKHKPFPILRGMAQQEK